MSGLVDWALARIRMILTFVVLTVGAGGAAYVGLPKEGSPNIDVPILFVTASLPGASAADVERLVLKPLETELRDLDGLKEMQTFATQGAASALLEFDFGWDKGDTVAETRDRLSRAETEFPDDAEDARVIEVNLSEFPVLVVSLSGAAPERTMTRLAKALERDIEALPSVLEVDLAGARDEIVEVLVDPLKLESLGLSAQELVAIVSRNNSLVPAGALEAGSAKFDFSVPGSFETAEEVKALPVKVSGDRIVRLGEVAEIRRTFEDRAGWARFNSEPTLALQVKKRLGANILDTTQDVRARVAETTADWPPALRAAVRVDFSLDRSREVRSMVSQLESSVLTAVLLVMIVVLAALGPRSALLVGLAVPSSFLLAFALFGALGYAVNNMVMFGLILAVGMLVDGAIVVAEYADKRMAEGAPPEAAYGEAAKRMFWPIVTSTATTLCAFLPMLLWPGLPGQFMGQLPLTLIFVLSASLLVALVYLPALGVVIGRASAAAGRALAPLGRLWRRAPRGGAPAAAPARRRSLFGRFMHLIVGNPIGPVAAIAVAIAALFGAFQLYAQSDNGVEFFVETEPERANVYVRARGNLSLAEQDRLVRRAEAEALAVEGVGAVFAFSGAGGLIQEGGEAPPDAVGQLQIELAPWEERLLRPDPLYGDAVLAEINARVSRQAGAVVEVVKLKEGPQQGKPIQMRIEAADAEALARATALARARFDADPELRDVDDTRPLPGIEWRYKIDREAAGRFGADVELVGGMLQLVTRGVELDGITPDDSDEEIKIFARFPAAERTLDQISEMRVRTADGMTPLSNFVTRAAEPKLGRISRVDGRRFFLVRAEAAEGANVNAKLADLRAWAEKARAEGALGAARVSFVGDFEEQQKSQEFLGQAFIGALGLMFVILLAQFNSVYNAVLVLSAVVMSIAGVLLGMVAMDQSFSVIMTGTGIVALAGIVVNNNIVLIDTYQDYARTMPALEAIRRTAEDRLRPVLLTTITTIAGLAPMMFAASIDFVGRQVSVGAPTALWWVQLATAVIWGLGFATLLTLIVTPAALALRVWVGRGLAAASDAAARLRAGGTASRDAALRRRLPTGGVSVDWTALAAETPPRPDPARREDAAPWRKGVAAE